MAGISCREKRRIQSFTFALQPEDMCTLYTVHSGSLTHFTTIALYTMWGRNVLRVTIFLGTGHCLTFLTLLHGFHIGPRKHHNMFSVPNILHYDDDNHNDYDDNVWW